MTLVKLDEIKLTVALIKKGMTIKELSERSGVARMTIGNAKAGKRIKMEMAVLIANGLEVNLEDILLTQPTY